MSAEISSAGTRSATSVFPIPSSSCLPPSTATQPELILSDSLRALVRRLKSESCESLCLSDEDFEEQLASIQIDRLPAQQADEWRRCRSGSDFHSHLASLLQSSAGQKFRAALPFSQIAEVLNGVHFSSGTHRVHLVELLRRPRFDEIQRQPKPDVYFSNIIADYMTLAQHGCLPHNYSSLAAYSAAQESCFRMSPQEIIALVGTGAYVAGQVVYTALTGAIHTTALLAPPAVYFCDYLRKLQRRDSRIADAYIQMASGAAFCFPEESFPNYGSYARSRFDGDYAAAQLLTLLPGQQNKTLEQRLAALRDIAALPHKQARTELDRAVVRRLQNNKIILPCGGVEWWKTPRFYQFLKGLWQQHQVSRAAFQKEMALEARAILSATHRENGFAAILANSKDA